MYNPKAGVLEPSLIDRPGAADSLKEALTMEAGVGCLLLFEAVHLGK